MDKKPKKGEYLEVILRSSQTVFSTRDVALLWGEDRSSVISNRLKSYAKSGKLIRIHHGLYAKDNNYNRFELATRINTPSYVSFETILTQEGVNFQYYSAIYVASYINREMVIGGQKITFIRMKDDVVSDTTGIEHRDGYARATKERAFLDKHRGIPIRATGTAFGHTMEAQFPLGIALAALSISRGKLFAANDPTGLEVEMTKPPSQIVVVGAGHWRGEGMALVEAI